MGGDVVQQVQVTDRAGGVWVAYYAMQRQSDGSWRTNGCHLVQPQDHARIVRCIIRRSGCARPAVVAPSAVWRGRPYPLGATWDGAGVNFALFSKHAERVELCLFEPKGRREIERVELRERSDFVWHCYLPEARPGLLYGYRVHGPHDPGRGHRFDPRQGRCSTRTRA